MLLCWQAYVLVPLPCIRQRKALHSVNFNPTSTISKEVLHSIAEKIGWVRFS